MSMPQRPTAPPCLLGSKTITTCGTTFWSCDDERQFHPSLQSLGYTHREAAFLYLVTIHSGYFLRRQFDYFIRRGKGAIVANFLAKAQAARHIEVIEYVRGWRVYHLLSRTIYRLANLPESGNRHRKGDASIRASLITLDCVLENHETEYFLTTRRRRSISFGNTGTVRQVSIEKQTGNCHQS